MKAKNVLAVFLILILLILDWLALDDITTGNESDYWGEWATILISAVVFGFLIFRKLRGRPAKK